MAVAARSGVHSQAEDSLLREKCRRSAHVFVFEAGLQTKDEHDTLTPAKVMPDMPYLRVLLDACLVSGQFVRPDQATYALQAGYTRKWLQNLHESQILMLEKSRQMLVSWLLCCFALWRAKYHANQLILVQSKKEDDAFNMVFVGKEAFYARISFLESHLPNSLRTLVFPRHASQGRLYFPNGSQIWGIPQGGDIIRSNTPSLIISDEAAFQEEFDKAYTAALPAIKGGGQLICCSSAEPSAFQTLVEGTD